MPEDPSKTADDSPNEPSAHSRAQAESHYYAALDHVAEGSDDKAIDEYRQSLAADPSFTDALHGLSRALQNFNRFDEAIEVAQQISAHQSSRTTGLYDRRGDDVSLDEVEKIAI